MDQDYYLMYQQALAGRNMFFTMIDNARLPIAQEIRAEVVAIVDDMKDQRHPRSVEDRIKALHRHLSKARQRDHVVMRVDENVALHDHYERLRRALRQHPSY